MTKREKNIIEGLSELTVYVKKASIYTACGKSAVWFSQRFQQGKNRGTIYAFTQNDSDVLNDGLKVLANKIRRFNISLDVPRNQVVEDMREICKVVNSAYLRDVLGCNNSYWKCRTQSVRKSDGCYLFTAEEADTINKALQNIASILYNTTLIV